MARLDSCNCTSDSYRLDNQSRREFLQRGILVLASSSVLHSSWKDCLAADSGNDVGRLRFGVVTDAHYGNKDPHGLRA
jgi:hypothetical protein